MRHIAFAEHLRPTADQAEALEAALDAACPDEIVKKLVMKSKPDVATKSPLYRNRPNLDPCGMLMERREFEAVFRNTPDLLQSVHLFTDGSPITGKTTTRNDPSTRSDDGGNTHIGASRRDAALRRQLSIG